MNHKGMAAPKTFNFDWALVCLLAVVALVNGLCLPNDFMPGDPVAMREETRAILEGRGLAIEEQHVKLFGEAGQYVVENVQNGRHYSKYGIMSSIMYLVPMAFELATEGKLVPLMGDARITWLNWYNWALSIVLAFVLYRILEFFTKKRWLAVAFVVAEFYATFLWSYLRIQNSEIFQILFFSAFALAALRLYRAWDSRGEKARAISLAWAWFWALCLALTKVSYILMGPIFAASFAFFLREGERDGVRDWASALKVSFKRNLIPGSVLLATVLAVNFVKFGSPFLTGYHQWRPEIHSLRGDPTDSVYGLFFSAQWSLFFHFPLFALALFGWKKFFDRDRAVSIFLLSVGGLYLLLLGLLPSWRGEMCYGPRYFLFLLVVLSMPAATVVESLLNAWGGSLRAKGAALACAVVVAWSGVLQFEVIRYPFLAFYQARDPLGQNMPIGLAIFFVNSHYGRVNWELSRWVDDPSRLDVMADAQKAYTPESFNSYKEHLKRVYSNDNFFWVRRPHIN